ncbi:MAG: hypothetical protein AB1641_02255 [Thermodesulfobacteriota bacterium]
MKVNAVQNNEASGLEPKSSLVEVRYKIGQALKRYQQDQFEAMLAFQQAVAKLSGYGGKINGVY